MPTIVADRQTVAPIDWQQNDLYRFFSVVFGPPTHECFSLLSQLAMPRAIENLWRSLECEGEFPGFEWFTSYELYESAYIALFDVGVPEPPVPLFESAHDKSRPAQEIALENTYFYEVLGLKSNPSRAVPDYLVTQLEFLAALRYTSENTSEDATAVALARAETEFLERHLLNWLPLARTKLDRTGAPGFLVLMTMLAQFLDNRHAVRTS
ncbi:MAG: molecular chaperone TorD family protein [Acidobacteriia bacterium]|nr:molecular chaperone TorD family protein [Terriglobia bacterium]